MRVIGIAFSDLHFQNWKQFNDNRERMETTFSIIERIAKAAVKHNCPILFPGDLVDHPKYVENVLLAYVGRACWELEMLRLKVIGINGNHDLPKINTFKNPVEGYLHHFSKMGAPFICVDFKHYDTPFYRVHGIPYINGNVDFIDALKDRIKNLSEKGNILMIHRDLAGAQEPDGRIIDKDPEGDKKIKKLFKKFDLVISGHIHKPQKIRRLGKNVYMLGSTNHQRRTDADCKMGYWKIYEDYSMEFFDLKMPQFKYLQHDEEAPNDRDYFIRLPKKEQQKASGEYSHTFRVADKRDKLAKKYLKAKGIKSKRKFNTLMKYI